MNQILNIRKIDSESFKVDVPEGTTVNDLEFGLMSVMYKILIKQIKHDNKRVNKKNFKKYSLRYSKAINEQLVMMYGIMNDHVR